MDKPVVFSQPMVQIDPNLKLVIFFEKYDEEVMKSPMKMKKLYDKITEAPKIDIAQVEKISQLHLPSAETINPDEERLKYDNEANSDNGRDLNSDRTCTFSRHDLSF